MCLFYENESFPELVVQFDNYCYSCDFLCSPLFFCMMLGSENAKSWQIQICWENIGVHNLQLRGPNWPKECARKFFERCYQCLHGMNQFESSYEKKIFLKNPPKGKLHEFMFVRTSVLRCVCNQFCWHPFINLCENLLADGQKGQKMGKGAQKWSQTRVFCGFLDFVMTFCWKF